jgi:hypothetical protein
MLTSQYGDLDKEISAFTEKLKRVPAFLEDYFGFHHNLLGLVAVASYCVPHFFCLSFCVLYWETEFSKEVNVIKMYPHIWMLQLLLRIIFQIITFSSMLSH